MPCSCFVADDKVARRCRNRLTQDLELLRHADPSVPWRIAFEPAEHLVTLTLVKPGGLEMDGEQHCPGAAAPRSLLFRRLDDPGAEPFFAHPLGQKEAVDKQKAHRGAPDQTADDRPVVLVGDQNGERPLVPVARLLEIVGAEPLWMTASACSPGASVRVSTGLAVGIALIPARHPAT
jgi:hypothetical protein